MASHHRHANFRRRALGVLALNDGRSDPAISGVLRVSVPQLYNWALAWRERGLMGMLSGHVGGAPRKLTAPLLQTAVQVACDESLTLAKIAQRVKEQHPDAPSFSLSRLSVGLRAQGLSYKRNRLSLKKSETNSALMKPVFVTCPTQSAVGCHLASPTVPMPVWDASVSTYWAH